MDARHGGHLHANGALVEVLAITVFFFNGAQSENEEEGYESANEYSRSERENGGQAEPLRPLAATHAFCSSQLRNAVRPYTNCEHGACALSRFHVTSRSAPPPYMAGKMARVLPALLLLLAFAHGTLSKNNAVPMQKFTIDLDKPPEERWLELLSHYNSSVPAIVKYFDQQVIAQEGLGKEGKKREKILLKSAKGGLWDRESVVIHCFFCRLLRN